MARFHIHKNPNGAGYLLDVQADLLSQLNTRVVVPLLPLAAAPKPIATLNPVFSVKSKDYVMVTQYLAAVETKMLKEPLQSAKDRRDEVTAALDMLYQGF